MNSVNWNTDLNGLSVTEFSERGIRFGLEMIASCADDPGCGHDPDKEEREAEFIANYGVTTDQFLENSPESNIILLKDYHRRRTANASEADNNQLSQECADDERVLNTPQTTQTRLPMTGKTIDAVHYGDLDKDMMEELVTVAWGSDRQDRNWLTKEMQVGDLLKLLSKIQVGKKDGTCITQGSLAGSSRNSKSVTENNILMLDLDTGVDMDTLHARVEELNLFCMMWTTHSHGVATTDINRDVLVKWSGEKNPKIQHALAYLLGEKNYTAEVLEGAEAAGQKHTEKGVVMVVKHNPIPKIRLLFILAEPFIFADRPGTHADAITEWKERYAGMSNEINAVFDNACVDPARLMYTGSGSF